MTTQAKSELSFRTYGADHPVHAHDHMQIVLPLKGELEIEVDGRGARLNAAQAAVVPPGAKHTQFATGDNLALVVDCPGDRAESSALLSKIFRSIPVQTQRLLAFLELSNEEGDLSELTAEHAMPLLLDSLGRETPTSATQRIRTLVAGNPFENWSVSRMASVAGMSVSSFHTAFRADVGESPARFAAKERLRMAVALLNDRTLSVAEIALRCGYSDQTALTRAMKRELGVTPGSLRRRPS